MVEQARPSPKKLLVVDDEESVREMILHFLETEGFAIELASTGMEAMEKLASEDFDLLIVDLMLPGTNGMEIVRELQGPGWKKIPVIVVTGKHVDQKEEATIRAQPNVAAFLRKPLHHVEIVKLVGALLGSRPS